MNMWNPLPNKCESIAVSLPSSITDTGDTWVPFAFYSDEDMAKAAACVIVGLIFPAAISEQHLRQVLGELREHNARLVIMSREDVAAAQRGESE